MSSFGKGRGRAPDGWDHDRIVTDESARMSPTPPDPVIPVVRPPKDDRSRASRSQAGEKSMSERPPPPNLLEVRRPSAKPIPREEPSSEPEPSPPQEPAEAAEQVAIEFETEVVASQALVRQFRPEDLLRPPAEPFAAASGEDVPEGMATEEQLDDFRELRTRLLAMAAGLSFRHFTTLVVPMTSGAGGSFVARNLAAAFALQDGRAAMLVDCNLKSPTQHEAFGTSAVGLFDFLDEPGVQYDSLLRMTGIPALHLIPAGRARSKFREYFSSAPMKALMEAVRKSEYFVFLDGPAAKSSPDARILSEYADFVILVVGYGSGTAQEIAQVAAMFNRDKFAGVVFNERG